MKNQLAEEDVPMYQGPVALGDIPVYLTPSFLEEVNHLGVVGGGKQPLHLQVRFDRGLISVSWEKADEQTVSEYEIQCDLMEKVSDVDPKSKPRSVKCKGTATQQWIDKLIPGNKYSFRIRSLNMAGWGIWSMPVACHYPSLPITIEYTGEIVEFVVPANGLYCITAQGAKAADGETRKGGRGAIIEAKFLLNK